MHELPRRALARLGAVGHGAAGRAWVHGGRGAQAVVAGLEGGRGRRKGEERGGIGCQAGGWGDGGGCVEGAAFGGGGGAVDGEGWGWVGWGHEKEIWE